MLHSLALEERIAQNPSRERNEHGLLLFFDNLKLPLSTISSFEKAERCNNLSFEDIDQAADRLRTAAETIQSLTSDIGNNCRVLICVSNMTHRPIQTGKSGFRNGRRKPSGRETFRKLDCGRLLVELSSFCD